MLRLNKGEKNQTMIDNMQKITSYVSGTGLKVYEVEYYHKPSDNWYKVGDAYLNLEYVRTVVELNNLRLGLKARRELNK